MFSLLLFFSKYPATNSPAAKEPTMSVVHLPHLVFLIFRTQQQNKNECKELVFSSGTKGLLMSVQHK